jgi:voltage-gated potassium channel
MTDAGIAEDRGATDDHVDLGFSWEMFVLLLSVLSIVNLVLSLLPIAETSKEVILVVDGALSIVFMADFLRRLQVAPSKGGYFVRGGGFLDLIGSIPVPGLRVARIFRIIRAVRMVRRYGLAGMARRFGEGRAEGSILLVIFIAVVVLEFASIFILGAERVSPDANITSASDGMWWGFVTITTVGYGDRFPVTNAGRVVGVFLMIIGVGLFSTFAGYLANAFLAPHGARKRVREETAAEVSDPRAAALDEIRGLLEEQERVTGELRARLTDLEP